MDTSNKPAVRGGPASGTPRLGWRALLAGAGWSGAVTFGMVAVFLGDYEAGAVAVGFGVSSLLLRVHRGRLGAIGIALVSLITLYFMGTAAVTNAGIGSPIGWVFVTALLAGIAIVGAVASTRVLLGRGASAAGNGPLFLVGVATLWIAGMTTWGLLSSEATAPSATASLTAENVSFSVGYLAVASGDVRIEMTNRDLFWHTFTVEELGVDLRVPVGAVRTISFQAAPGIYEFICRIPGHSDAGMKGTLLVSEA